MLKFLAPALMILCATPAAARCDDQSDAEDAYYLALSARDNAITRQNASTTRFNADCNQVYTYYAWLAAVQGDMLPTDAATVLSALNSAQYYLDDTWGFDANYDGYGAYQYLCDGADSAAGWVVTGQTDVSSGNDAYDGGLYLTALICYQGARTDFTTAVSGCNAADGLMATAETFLATALNVLMDYPPPGSG